MSAGLLSHTFSAPLPDPYSTDLLQEGRVKKEAEEQDEEEEEEEENRIKGEIQISQHSVF